MANEVRIHTSVQGGRGVIAQVNAIKSSFKELQADLSAQSALAFGEQLGKSLDRIGQSMSKIGGQMTRNLTVPIVAAGAAITLVGKDFDTTLRQIVALTDATQQEIAGVRTKILDLASAVGKDPEELAKGYYFLRSAGMDAAQSMDVLTQAAKAAASGMGDTADLAKVVASSINAFGKENLTATDAFDQLLRAIKDGTAEAPDFANALGTVISTAAQLGSSFADTTGAIAAMTLKGIDADTAATNLNQIFVALLKTTPQAEAQLKALGLSSASLRQEIRDKGLLATLQTLQTAFGDNDVAIANVFGNVRALRGVLALLQGDGSQTAKVMDDVANGSANLGDAFKQTDGPGRALDQAITDLKIVLIDLSTDVLPAAVTIMRDLSGIIKAVAGAFKSLPEPVRGGVVQLLAFAAAAGPVLLVLGKLTSGIGRTIGALASFARIMAPLGTRLASGLASAIGGLPNASAVKAAITRAGAAIGLSLSSAIGIGLAAAGGLAIAAGYKALFIDPGLDRQTQEVGRNIAYQLVNGTAKQLYQSKQALQQAIADINAVPGQAQIYAGQLQALQSYLDAVSGRLDELFAKIPESTAQEFDHGWASVTYPTIAADVAQIPAAVEEQTAATRAAAAKIPDSIAQGVLDHMNAPVDAMDTLRNLMQNALKTPARITRDIGLLTSKTLARALRDSRPSVVAEAKRTRTATEKDLANLIIHGGKVGKEAMTELKKAMHSKDPEVRAEAKRIYRIVKGELDGTAPAAYDAGKNATTNFGRGLVNPVVIASLRAKAERIGAILDAQWQTHSPSKEGPFSKGGGPEGWGKRWGQLYVRGLESGLAGVGGLINGLGGPMAPAMAGGGASLTINVNGVSILTPGAAQALGQQLGPVVTRWQQGAQILPRR